MACVPMINKKKRSQFEVTVNLHSLMSVPYVNAVIFTKMRLLNSRNSRQISPRVEVVDHYVPWNSSHKFQCNMQTDPESNVLESCKLKISVRMETKGGKSFRKIGYVTVNLACFAGNGNVRCRRRYILEGYEEKRKRQDNSLLMISFTCRQCFGNTCFRVPPEDMSNCVSTPSNALAGGPMIPDNEGMTLLPLPSTSPIFLSSGRFSAGAHESVDTPPVAHSSQSSPLLTATNSARPPENRTCMRCPLHLPATVGDAASSLFCSSCLRKSSLVDVPENVNTVRDTKQHSRFYTVNELEDDDEGIDKVGGSVKTPPPPPTSLVGDATPSLSSGQFSSEYVSPAGLSMDFRREEEDADKGSPPQFLFATPMQARLEDQSDILSFKSPRSDNSPPPDSAWMRSSILNSCSSSGDSTSTNPNSSPETSPIHAPLVHFPSHPTERFGWDSLPSSSGLGATDSQLYRPKTHPILSTATELLARNLTDSVPRNLTVIGPFHTCPHVRMTPEGGSGHQRLRFKVNEATNVNKTTVGTGDSGTGLHVGAGLHASSALALPCSTATSSEIVVGASPSSLIHRSHSSGFQSHSRNSSLESGPVGMDPAQLLPATTPTLCFTNTTERKSDWSHSPVEMGVSFGSKQHQIDATRVPFDDVVSQILRTTSSATARSNLRPSNSGSNGKIAAPPPPQAAPNAGKFQSQ